MVEAGPRKVSRRVTVAAKPAAVFALVSDPRRHSELDGSGTVGEAVQADGPMTVGGTFSVKMTMFGLPYRITSKVTQVQADRLVEWRHPAGHTWRYDLAPARGGGTVVTETWDYTTVKVPKLYELLGMDKRNVTGIEKTLTKLRARFAAQT